MQIMPTDRMKVFADLIHSQLGVRVKMRGRMICCVYGQKGRKPVIYLPNLEMAKEEELRPLFGFCLHEAGHARFSRPKAMRVIDSHLWKSIHNAFEDQFIERRLRSAFPGGKALLKSAHDEGYRLHVRGEQEGETLLGTDRETYIGNEKLVNEVIDKIGREQVRERMLALGLDPSDESMLTEVGKRLEIHRLTWLWLYDFRDGQDQGIREMFRSHPWKPVLDEINAEKTRNSVHAVAKARQLIDRLRVHPVLPGDARPVHDVKKLRELAKELRRMARECRAEARRLRDEREERIQKRVAESPEAAHLARLREAADNADADRLREMEPEIRDAEDDAEEAAAKIEQEEREATREQIRALTRQAQQDAGNAKKAKADSEELAVTIRATDKPGEEQIGPGIMAKVVAAIFDKVRMTPTAEDLPGRPRNPEDEGKTPVVPPPTAAMSARKYVVYDRSYDRVERIQETPVARKEYGEACKEYAKVIAETTERLRRLQAPSRPVTRVNADAGRLDPRKAVRLGLALRGAPVDVSRVWKETTTRPDPKVAVTLLLDCSGSMAGNKFTLARKAACCLSEVMQALHIPHEIVGHTTDSDGAGPAINSLAENHERAEDFSRLIPFRGVIFKEFCEKTPTASVFAHLSMEENLDGEAVQWALERLAKRREKTKLCIVLCDGMPAASFSKRDELERHLYTVVRHAEARVHEGLHVCALGIGEERVREFYRNAEVLLDVSDLPAAVLGIVERIMAKTAKAR